jgi:hypothetical protein
MSRIFLVFIALVLVLQVSCQENRREFPRENDREDPFRIPEPDEEMPRRRIQCPRYCHRPCPRPYCPVYPRPHCPGPYGPRGSGSTLTESIMTESTTATTILTTATTDRD